MRLRALPVVIALIALVAGLQVYTGAYRSDFDMTPDEPGHVVSTLLVRDYLVSGDLAHPWEFAKAYYVHYPKVAILHWPPLFYAAEAVWTLGAGRSRAGLFAFQALPGGALAAGIFLLLYSRHGAWIAGLSAALFITTPLVQMSAAMISPDLLLGGLVFWAAIIYANEWETRRGTWLVWVLAGCAVATHGRGAAFLLVPFLAPLFLNDTRKKTTRLILILPVFFLFATVPYVLRQAGAVGPRAIFLNSVTYFVTLGNEVRWPILAMALLGAWTVGRSAHKSPLMIVMMVTALSCWIFHSLVNTELSNYYLITAVPAVFVLAAAGTADLLQRVGTRWRIPAAGVALALAILNVASMPAKENSGALRLVQDDSFYRDSHKIWLVAGDATFEGAVIAEVALRDSARQHIVLRASKMLARSTWSGGRYRLLFPNTFAVSRFLDRTHVAWVITRLDGRTPHMGQLRAALHSSPDTWQRVDSRDSFGGFAIYKRVGPFPAGAASIEVNMTEKLRTRFRLEE